MHSTKTISIQATSLISDFISSLSQEGDLHTKTLKEYTSDLKDFVFWFENVWGKHAEDTLFHPIEVTARTIARYRGHMQVTRLLKPSTINRRINSIKRYFDWAKQKGLVQTNYSKSIKFVPTEKTSPKRMSDKEEAALMHAVEKYGTLRDRAMIIFMLHTGLRSMEVCDVQIEDVIMRKRGGYVVVRSGKRNKQREVPLNSTARCALEEHIRLSEISQSYLFPSSKTGKRLQERAIRHILQKYIRLAKLEGFSAHDLRHRFGYVMAERTPLHRLAQIMGHDNLNTTMIYVRATQEDLQGEVEKIAWN
ncbi:tyrosine-type recombinase/integrase [Lysinibacillus sphaericus]|uniref:Integrase n=8 Tax=root TaxID=1 RepID=A0A0A7AR08_9CAUD|nr:MULTISPECIES: tyrosine-type recombinase/integrase [Bacillaceae]YP_009194042.2 tyrosine-type recombinase/integrase [Bacillus phage vB_BtS_BMBtp3]MCU4862750.1 tyrosine-type recombinase/integrase [Bacillus cereus]PGZ45049.1 integrase [Bacillus anthracis]AAA64588.1 site-specific recombinase [Bacillus thuringiensis serovar morrisoni]AHC73236.1 site-specific recombinase XerD [Bacillus thuringiensis serovar tenebrionis str. YBT-1765]AHJ86773.2 integrase-recombinase protein [Bacillus phage vB_BtS_